MSKGRMEDLLLALQNEGWRLLSEAEYPRGSSDPFRLENDVARWGISRGDSPAVVELEFRAFGDLGQRTERLNDILYCTVPGTGNRLYFDKREKAEWRANVLKFVMELKQRTEH